MSIEGLQCHPGKVQNIRRHVFWCPNYFYVIMCDAHATYIMNNASTYYNELFPSDKQRYDKKLECLYRLATYCDPFGISDQHWVDDVSKWPPVDYPSIYTY